MVLQVVQQQLAQPGDQLGPRFALELGKIALGFEERFLDQVRGASLGLQFRLQLAVGDQQQ